MISHAALWLFTLALALLAVVARARSGAVTFMRPIVVMLSIGAIVVIVAAEERGSPVRLAGSLSLACAIVCAESDLATGLIFDGVTALGALMIALTTLVAGEAKASAIGAFVCAGSMLALYAITRGSGIGLGDVKLGAIIGAGCGGAIAIGAIGIAFVAGSIWVLPLLLRKRTRMGDRLAFAPLMALGTLASLGIHALGAYG